MALCVASFCTPILIPAQQERANVAANWHNSDSNRVALEPHISVRLQKCPPVHGLTLSSFPVLHSVFLRTNMTGTVPSQFGLLTNMRFMCESRASRSFSRDDRRLTDHFHSTQISAARCPQSSDSCEKLPNCEVKAPKRDQTANSTNATGLQATADLRAQYQRSSSSSPRSHHNCTLSLAAF